VLPPSRRRFCIVNSSLRYGFFMTMSPTAVRTARGNLGAAHRGDS
jgi:hypothetical protein